MVLPGVTHVVFCLVVCVAVVNDAPWAAELVGDYADADIYQSICAEDGGWSLHPQSFSGGVFKHAGVGETRGRDGLRDEATSGYLWLWVSKVWSMLLLCNANSWGFVRETPGVN